MNRHEAILKAANEFAVVIQANTKPGRAQDGALEMVRKAVDRANRGVIVDKLKAPKTEEAK